METYLTAGPFCTAAAFDFKMAGWLAVAERQGRRRVFERGAYLYREGQVVDTVGILARGMVLSAVTNSNGLEKASLTVAPYMLSLFPAWHGYPLLYHTVAHSEVVLYELPREALLEAMGASMGLSRSLMRMIAVETRLLYHSHLTDRLSTATEKVALVLFCYHLLRAEEALPPLRLTQQLLALLTGLHRTSVAQALAVLRAEGLIGKRPEERIDAKRLEVLFQKGFK